MAYKPIVLTPMQRRLGEALALGSASSIGLYVAGIFLYDSTRFWFLVWNLFLAWLPLLFAWLGLQRLRRRRRDQARWPTIALFGLWLGFLPNSFYIVSDFIHLRLLSGAQAFYYGIVITSFAVNGLILGFISLYLVHQQLIQRIGRTHAHRLVGIILLACSFAIYLGRAKRWNTWDVLINPAGILFDVSDPLVNPIARGQAARMTVVLLVFLATLYVMIWRIIIAARLPKD